MSNTASKLLYGAAILYTICVYGTMATMSVGAGVVFAAWLVARWGHHREDWKMMRASPVFLPTIALGAACLWSLVWAKLTHLEFMGMHPTITWDDTRKAWHLAFTFVFFAVLASLSDVRLRAVTKLWLALGVVAAALGVVQHWVPYFEPMQLPHTMRPDYAPPPGILGWLDGRYHATGFSGFHLSFAAIIGFPTAVMAAVLAVTLRRERFTKRTLLTGGSLGICFAASMLTYSKTAWVALPLTLLLIILLGLKGRVRHIVAGAVLVTCACWLLSAGVRERFADNHERSIVEREMVWSANLEMIKQFPVFGVGWHRNSELSRAYYEKQQIIYKFESHAHNNILDQAASTGLVGLAAFVWLNVVLALCALRLYHGNHELLWRTMGLGLVGGWFCLHINGLTQSNWWDAKVLHQISWVTALTMEAQRRLSKS